MKPLIVLACLFASTSALAQSPPPTFEAGKREDVKDVNKVDWTAKGEAGLVETTGNSKTTTATLGASAMRKDKDNKLELTLSAMFARATTRTAADANGNGVIDDGELSTATTTSAQNAAGKLRYDRFLTPTDALYAAALAATDKPAGKQFIGGGQAGYSRGLYKEQDHEVLGEVGYDFSYLKPVTGDAVSIHSGRAFVGYKGKLSKDTALEASGEVLFNLNSIKFGTRTASAFEETRATGIASVVSALSTKLSLSVSFTAKYDNFPPPLAKIGPLPFAPGYEPAADKLDTITKVSLIFKFL